MHTPHQRQVSASPIVGTPAADGSEGLTKCRRPDFGTDLVLHATPRGVRTREQRPALGSRVQLIVPMADGTTDVDQAPAHQRADIPEQRRTIHPESFGQRRQGHAVARRRGGQNRELRHADTERPEGRVVALRDDPRRPPEREAEAVLEILQLRAGRDAAGFHFTDRQTSSRTSEPGAAVSRIVLEELELSVSPKVPSIFTLALKTRELSREIRQ
jgi:hypothetical protein